MVSMGPILGTHIFRDSKMGLGLGNSMGVPENPIDIKYQWLVGWLDAGGV